MKNIEINFSDNKNFLRVEASTLTLKDDFLKYKTTNQQELLFRERLVIAIKRGLSDFYYPIDIIKLSNLGNDIMVGKSYIEWERSARKLIPGKSYLGNKTEYISFLGVFLKKLVDSGFSKTFAWNAICLNSKLLEEYFSNNEHVTENDELYIFYLLAGTQKILADEIEDHYFWIVNENDELKHENYSLTQFSLCYNMYYTDNGSEGWIICKE